MSLKKRQRANAALDDDTCRRYEAGESIESIAADLRVAASTIRLWLESRGIHIRSPGEAAELRRAHEGHTGPTRYAQHQVRLGPGTRCRKVLQALADTPSGLTARQAAISCGAPLTGTVLSEFGQALRILVVAGYAHRVGTEAGVYRNNPTVLYRATNEGLVALSAAVERDDQRALPTRREAVVIRSPDPPELVSGVVADYQAVAGTLEQIAARHHIGKARLLRILAAQNVPSRTAKETLVILQSREQDCVSGPGTMP